MDRNQFTSRVREYAKLDSDDQALQVSEAVLATLGECLYRMECDDLATELPPEIGELLFHKRSREQTREDVERISLDEFHNRVHARSDLPFRRSVIASLAVFSTLKEAVSPGQMKDVLAELPGELRQLVA